jgi:2'-5' RNA ligase
MANRGALIIPAPEAEAHVSRVRALHDPVAALGVPAHLTVIFPFATPGELESEELRALFAGFAAFPYDLVGVGTFANGTVWLEPAPRQPFAALTEAVWRRWPRWPPYGGLHDQVIPHLTVSEGPVDLSLAFPIRCQAREVVWLEEGADRRWRPQARFALGPAR